MYFLFLTWKSCISKKKQYGLDCTNNCDNCNKKYWKYIKYNSGDSNYQIDYQDGDTTGSTTDSLGLKWITNSPNHWSLYKKGNEQTDSSGSKDCMIKDITTETSVTRACAAGLVPVPIFSGNFLFTDLFSLHSTKYKSG